MKKLIITIIAVGGLILGAKAQKLPERIVITGDQVQKLSTGLDSVKAYMSNSDMKGHDIQFLIGILYRASMPIFTETGNRVKAVADSVAKSNKHK